MIQPQTMIKAIIIADDDPDDKDIFLLAIKEINPSLGVFNVSDGKELIELLKSFVPDMVFLDLDMPYKNGLECLVEMRNHPQWHGLPTVVYSSTTRPANIQTAYETGAHLFFIKPSVLKEYIQSLEAILKLDWKHPDKVKERYCVNGSYSAF